MNEPTNETKQDSFEDSSSSGEWTFIDGSVNIRETNNLIKKEVKKADLNEPIPESPKENEEPTITEHIEEIQEPKSEDSEEEEVEKGEEAGENDVDSDDVSIISDEEPEHTTYQETRIQNLEHNQLRESSSDQPKRKPSLRHSRNILFLFGCLLSMTIMSLAFMSILGLRLEAMINFQESNFHSAFVPYNKYKTEVEFKENLENLHKALNRFNGMTYKLPEVENLIVELRKTVENFVKLRSIQRNPFKHISNRVELVVSLYENYCNVYTQSIDDTDEIPESCQIPYMVHRMISFENEYAKLRSSVTDDDSKEEVDKSALLKALENDKNKIDFLVDEVLFEFLEAFSTFSTKFQKLNKLKFESPTLDPRVVIIIGGEPDDTISEKKTTEKEEVNERSKGEIKYDWKKNKYENKDKQSSEERKYNKREKNENYIKNNNKKFKHEHEIFKHGTYERVYRPVEPAIKTKAFRDHVNDYEENIRKMVEELEPTVMYKGKSHGNHYKPNKKMDTDYKRKFENNKKIIDYDNKSDHEKNYIGDKVVFSRKEKNNKEDDYKNYCESGQKCEKNKYYDDDDDDDDDDDNDSDDDAWSGETTDNEDNNRKKDNWLENRSKDRQKQRNSDWYSARADSREWARIEEEDVPKSFRGSYFNNRPLFRKPRRV